MTQEVAVSRVSLGVSDLEKAIAEYTCLLGKSPDHVIDDERALFALANATIELKNNPKNGKAKIDCLAFHIPDMPSPNFGSIAIQSDSEEDGAALNKSLTRGLPLAIDRERASDRIGAVPKEITSGVSAVDHIVVNTTDGDDIIRLFRDDLGIRLALDQTVEKWGGRMLYFRTGKFTIEVIDRQKEEQTDQPDSFWGIALQTPDLAATHARLVEAGVTISEVRTGRKPGTIVATPKSHTLGIPTLLIGPEA